MRGQSFDFAGLTAPRCAGRITGVACSRGGSWVPGTAGEESARGAEVCLGGAERKD